MERKNPRKVTKKMVKAIRWPNSISFRGIDLLEIWEISEFLLVVIYGIWSSWQWKRVFCTSQKRERERWLKTEDWREKLRNFRMNLGSKKWEKWGIYYQLEWDYRCIINYVMKIKYVWVFNAKFGITMSKQFLASDYIWHNLRDLTVIGNSKQSSILNQFLNVFPRKIEK